MTTEEKLKHFLDVTVETEGAQAQKSLAEYRKGLESVFASYQVKAKQAQELKLKFSERELKKEINTEIAEEQVNIRRYFIEKQDELLDQLFQEVDLKLLYYKKSESYKEYLAGHIREIQEFAKGEDVQFFLDPEDGDMKAELEEETGAELSLSLTVFNGGIRASIPAKNIMIDHSFESKLQEVRNDFAFHLD